PGRDDAWLAAFSRGMMALAQQAGCPLLGGDTTRTAQVGEARAPVTISITAMGALPASMGLTRAGARPGDDIWVSGTLGGACAALKHRLGQWSLPATHFPAACERLDRPAARNALGTALLPVATACADVSDGLAQDLGHILERSAVAADVLWDAVPAHPSLAALTAAQRVQAVLAGGDDYELVFTAPHDKRGLVEQAAISALTPVACIGRVRALDSGAPQLTVKDAAGADVRPEGAGFDHFA
ncbi:MAG: thiamine-phosphate kinase, partial [Duodenibacillus sp.]|nr:thiamine-phosphate kinase [Duodenibacillus sp.]